MINNNDNEILRFIKKSWLVKKTVVVLSQILMQNKTYAMTGMLRECYLNVNTFQNGNKRGNGE